MNHLPSNKFQKLQYFGLKWIVKYVKIAEMVVKSRETTWVLRSLLVIIKLKENNQQNKPKPPTQIKHSIGPVEEHDLYFYWYSNQSVCATDLI